MEFKSILHHRKAITLKDVLVQALGSFGNGDGNLIILLHVNQLMVRDIEPVRFAHQGIFQVSQSL